MQRAASRLLITALQVASMVGGCVLAHAQTATISGDMFAFDTVNTTGVVAHGFELQIEGALIGDIYYSDAGSRYGVPSIVPYSTGVYIRWQSTYSGSNGYAESTPVNVNSTFQWQDCYLGGSGYASSGCEHFGQSTFPTGTRVLTATGRWMIDNPASPGTLISYNPPVPVPFPSWTAGFGSSFPTVTAVVEAPEPPETPETYGDAQWMKTYTAQRTHPVVETDLSTTNTAIVPENAAQLEVAWDLVQASPPSNGNGGGGHGSQSNSGSLKATTQAVVRRYELYKYTGTYDSTTHQAVCIDPTCAAPSTGELGPFLSATNSATNVVPDSLTVKLSGSGTVSGGGFGCGSKCTAFVNKGTAITVTALPASGRVFGGWSGACSGTQLTCTVTVSGEDVVTASFLSQHTLSVSKSNASNGNVNGATSTDATAISCGSNCSAKFTDGTVILLTATPVAGKTLVNWTNGCTGTATTCRLRISKDTSVQANFSK